MTTTMTDVTEDVTLELNELRAALLAQQEEENEAPIWHNNNVADDSFLRLASSLDVESLLESIGTRTNRLKNELSAAALSLTPDSATQFAAAPSDALETIATLKAELEKCSRELVSDASLSKFEAEEVEARESRLARISRLEQLVSALHVLASHQRYCDDFDRQLEQGLVVEALGSLTSMDECAATMAKMSSAAIGSSASKNASNVAASRVAKAARVQARSRRAALQARLDEALIHAIQVDVGKHELIVHLDTKSDRIHASIRLERVIEALKAMKTAGTRLQERVAQPLLNHFLIPVITESGRFTAEQDLSDPSRPCLRLKSANNNGGNIKGPTSVISTKQNCQKVLSDVQIILRFIWSEIFNRDAALNQQLTLYANIEPLLRNVLRDAVPDTFAELQTFGQDLTARVGQFDQELERIGSTSRTSDKLSEFMADVEANFAKKLRERYAERVRMAIRGNEDLQRSERVDEDDEPEFFIGTGDFAVAPEMRISRSARKVVQIANDALLEAATAPEVCADALIIAARTCFDLFRALVPFLRKDEIQVNPRCAMLHRNDYDYIAHHLVLLGHRHRHLKTFVSVDLAPPFFDEADRTFQREIEIRCKLMEDTFFASALDFSEVLSKSDAVYKSWSEVLPRRLADASKAKLGEALAEGAFKAVCSKEANVSSLPERRALLKRLVQFGEAVKARGASSKRIDQLCKALQPHMSLFPLFADLVDSELHDWPPENLVGLANALFSKTATPEELKRFEEKILFY